MFWLDETRAHDAELLKKVRPALERARHRRPADRDPARRRGARFTLARARAGEDTISVTGNVLRDYLTDLFPILELGTSAKMLSIVPLMDGGGMFETGAGGSAPKHVQQFVRENHLRWDSLGEFLALAVSFELLAEKDGQRRARRCSPTRSTARPAGCSRSASRRCGGSVSSTTAAATSTSRCTGRRSWRSRTDDPELAERFGPLAERLAADEQKIVGELTAVQGQPVEIGGYYHPDLELVAAAMRPSATLNAALETLRAGGLRAQAVG